MDIGSVFGTNTQSVVVREPGEGAFDRPAVDAETGSVAGAAAGNGRDYAAGADGARVLVVAVAVRSAS
nr:hypothetical protein [Nocardia harenae]